MDASPRPTWRSRTWIAAGGMIALLVVVLSVLGLDGPQSLAVVLTTAGILAVGVLVWATVRSQRQRREYERSLTDWAAERAAQQERLRIARELHDLASHGLGLITMRAAAVAPLEGVTGDAERRRALVDIEEAGRSAMSELRRMLTVLREPGDEVPLQPPARLSEVPGIVTAAEAFGVRASLRAEDLGEVPPAVEAAACATVREALANVGRHAGPVPARVAVERDGNALRVVVADDGPARGWQSQPGAGHGLRGMRERVGALGGTLIAEPVGTGFRVGARLPFEAGA
ncbi:sensor histidine kinase [Microbacterium sp. NPDC055665]